jgi:hypothetical protein
MVTRLVLAVLASLLVLPGVVRAEPGDSCKASSDCDDGERCRQLVCVPKSGHQSTETPTPDSDDPGPSNSREALIYLNFA